MKQSSKIMLQSMFSRVNSMGLRNLVGMTRKLSGIEHQYRKKSENAGNDSSQKSNYIAYASVPTVLAFLQKKRDGEDETASDGKLKTILEHTKLCIQRGEFQKAEEMAQSAFLLAQDYDDIILCYDVIANLAFKMKQYEKAKKNFETVLQLLEQKGVARNDIQVDYFTCIIFHRVVFYF